MEATLSSVPSVGPIVFATVGATPLPVFQIDPTVFAAWFGGIVSLLLLIFEIYKYSNDTGKLNFRISFDMVIIGQTPSGVTKKLEPGKTFWSIDISNPGTKNIVFKQLYFDYHGSNKHAVVSHDYSGPVNKFTLLPGESHQFTIPYDLVHPKKVKSVMVLDAVGKIYKKRVSYRQS